MSDIKKELSETEREILKDKMTTAYRKVQLINEIKNGLGSDIKANPRGVKVIKIPFLKKVGNFLKTLFTKF